jgi:hypothetical protein
MIWQLLTFSGDHVEAMFQVISTVFQGNTAMLAEWHFPIAVEADARCNQDGQGVQSRKFPGNIHDLFKERIAKKRRKRRLDRRVFLRIPIHAEDEIGQFNRFAGLDSDTGVQFLPRFAPAPAPSCAGRVFRRKSKRFRIAKTCKI